MPVDAIGWMRIEKPDSSKSDGEMADSMTNSFDLLNWFDWFAGRGASDADSARNGGKHSTGEHDPRRNRRQRHRLPQNGHLAQPVQRYLHRSK